MVFPGYRMNYRMARILNNIISVIFLLVFLLPSLVKLEHHHEDFKCKAINEKHIHVQHEKCIVCNLEFSIFLSDDANTDFLKENPLEYFCDNYDSVYFSNPSQFSFSLRGPPVILI
jgi:hypothetical protein